VHAGSNIQEDSTRYWKLLPNLVGMEYGEKAQKDPAKLPDMLNKG
jgi:hypothetical protein